MALKTMKNHSLLLMFTLCVALSSVQADNALSRIEQSCAKFPSPGAQAECRQKEKAAMEAFEKERKKDDRKIEFKKDGPARKNDLCFTRKSTGEQVCPN
jgi:hypothetical protein